MEKQVELLMRMDDAELLREGELLRQRVRLGKAPTNAALTAFALVKEAVRRESGIRLHPEQLIGGWAMLQGHVAEMRTGEGKTVVSLLPLYWFGLQGEGVHMITVNRYLAERDCEQARNVLGRLGMTVALNHSELNPEEKKQAYLQDITYGTWSEFGFDYLRDRLVYDPDRQVQRPLACAVIDEIDSVLIDEARTPILIAGKTKGAPDLYYICDKFVRGLKEDRDYEIDRETMQVMFTEAGIRKVESTFMVDNLFHLDNTTVYHYLLQSLRAHKLMQHDRDYLVSEGKVNIIDAFTGRMMKGREFSDGLHQAIEVKEGLSLSAETRANASITVQKFFGLYRRLLGMTGTIETDQEELARIYGLEVLSVPTHRPVQRVDAPDLVFVSKEAKYRGLQTAVQELHARGTPVLVGTTSVQQSYEVAERLQAAGIPCQVLNARTEREEADIIGRAGQRGAVTIATNMAGRGADIRLGAGVEELGGLHVIGLERHESRRIDLQLRGRSGRQGSPGRSQFFVSLEDELFQRFAEEEAERWIRQWAWGEEGVLHKPLNSFVEHVQRRAERHMFDIRSLVYRFDCVIHRQREWYYTYRSELLESSKASELLKDCLQYWLDEQTAAYCPQHQLYEEWDVRRLQQELALGAELKLNEMLELDDVQRLVRNRWSEALACLESEWLDAQWKERWRVDCLMTMDRYWQDHMEQLQYLKQAIHFRAIEKRDPVDAFEEEAIHLLNELKDRVSRRIGSMLSEEVKTFTLQPSFPSDQAASIYAASF